MALNHEQDRNDAGEVYYYKPALHGFPRCGETPILYGRRRADIHKGLMLLA